MFADIKIEKGVELPKSPMRSEGITRLLRQMEIDDSFLIPADKTDKKRQSSITAQCSQFAKNKAFKFTVRWVEGGYRVWKISRDTTT